MRTMLTVPRENRWALVFLVMALATFAALLSAPSAHASSGYVNTWGNLHPGSASENNASCQLCHGSPGTANLNPYGAQIASSCGNTGNITQRINAADARNLNSDNDPTGSTDIQEANASTQPGWTTAGPSPVVTRGGCNPAGNNTAPAGIGQLDPAAPPVNTPPVANPNTYNTGFNTQQIGRASCRERV